MAKKSLTENADGTKTYAVPTTSAGGGPPLSALVSTDSIEKVARGFEQLSLPPIIKPREIPTHGWVMGEITGIMDSPIKEYKNRIIQITSTAPHNPGFKFCFPMTAVIDKAMGANPKEQNEKIGRTILIRKTGEVKSRNARYKKPVGLFEVYIKN